MFVVNNIEERELPLPEDQLTAISDQILHEFLDPAPDCTLSFVSPEEIKELNKTFRKVDEVTDVLSFNSEGEVDPETKITYLGDVVICLERAEEQAKISGHPLENEIKLLEIHGLLHLLGFDHDTDENKQKMWATQNDYLDYFDIELKRKPGEDYDF